MLRRTPSEERFPCCIPDSNNKDTPANAGVFFCQKEASKASTCVRLDGAASMPHFERTLDSILLSNKGETRKECERSEKKEKGRSPPSSFLKGGLGERFFTKNFSPNGMHSHGASRADGCCQLIDEQMIRQLLEEPARV